MIAFKRDSDMPYKMHCTPEDVSLICNQEKKFPKEWINAAETISPMTSQLTLSR